MLVHIVFWKLLDQAPNGKTKQENAIELQRRFEALRGQMPGLARIEVGVDISRTGESADVALYTEFDSPAALEAYQVHPLHKDVVGFLKDIRSERRVVDYER